MSGREFNAEEFHSIVYDLVRLIPEGRVTTYGTCLKRTPSRLTVQDTLPRYVVVRSATLTCSSLAGQTVRAHHSASANRRLPLRRRSPQISTGRHCAVAPSHWLRRDHFGTW